MITVKSFISKKASHDCIFKTDPNENLPSPVNEVAANQILRKFSLVKK